VLEQDVFLDNVFVHDCATGGLRLLSQAPDGAPADAPSRGPAIDGGGDWIAFTSTASNLLLRGADDSHDDVFLAPAPHFSVVEAGADSYVEVDALLQLDARVAPGLDARWALVSGPGNARFVDPTLTDATVSFDTPGSYTLRLSAGGSSDDVVINVLFPGEPPPDDEEFPEDSFNG